MVIRILAAVGCAALLVAGCGQSAEQAVDKAVGQVVDQATQQLQDQAAELGIDLPAGSIALPLAHRSTLRVALPLGDVAAAVDLGALPSAVQVSRGWLQVVEGASRLVCADAPIADAFD